VGPLRKNVALGLVYCVLLLFASHAAFAGESPIQSPSTVAASEGSAGALNPRTGEVYPQTPGGALNPRTGEVYPEVPGGVLNPRTGEVYPKTGSGYINPSPGRSPEVAPVPSPPPPPLPSLPSSPQTPWSSGR
jgi:hypothetical protein